MATAPATPSPAPNQFESFLTNFGKALENIANAAVNIAQQEAPVITPLLPPAIGAQFTTVLSAAAQQVAAADAKYAALGQSDVPFGVKVAEAIAIGGGGVLAIAAQAGLVISEGGLTTLFTAAYNAASVLNLKSITSAPATPPAS